MKKLLFIAIIALSTNNAIANEKNEELCFDNIKTMESYNGEKYNQIVKFFVTSDLHPIYPGDGYVVHKNVSYYFTFNNRLFCVTKKSIPQNYFLVQYTFLDALYE